MHNYYNPLMGGILARKEGKQIFLKGLIYPPQDAFLDIFGIPF